MRQNANTNASSGGSRMSRSSVQGCSGCDEERNNGAMNAPDRARADSYANFLSCHGPIAHDCFALDENSP